jgi:hypothetical protein
MLKAGAAGPVPVAIAAAQQHKVLIATGEAQSRGIIQAILVGDAKGIHQIADERGWLV